MRHQNPRTRRRVAATVIAVPAALSIASGALMPAAAQSSLSSGSSGSSGLFDYLDDGAVPSRDTQKTEYPKIEGLPDGVEVQRQEWLGSHRIALFIKSKAMPHELIQVQLLLARDWYSNPDATFPTVWMLDGLRANDIENGWTLHTNAEQFYADKNVTVVLPVGGGSTFYTDWQEPVDGKHFKWETFLTQELPAVMANGYRANGQRAISGLSMGGTAAMNIAQHRPDLFNFVGSYSGYLSTSASGAPQLISGAIKEGAGWDATKMWGPFGSQGWIDNDPLLGIEALKGKTVYVSAGNGRDDYGEDGSVAVTPGTDAGRALEGVSRLTTSTFVKRAADLQVPVISKMRDAGVHDWPYWQFEMSQAWPYIADALGLGDADRGSDCETIGAIGELTDSGAWGSCVNNEYDVPGGKAQDFRGGQAYWSPETGAHVLIGRIGARYNELGGPASFLGFPLTNEEITPDGDGRFVHFEHGSIYWTAETGAWAIPKDMFAAWERQGYETGTLGYPVGEPKDLNGSVIQRFQGGYVVRTPHKNADGSHKVFFARGAIAVKYGELKATASALGAPTSDEFLINGGALQNFEHGHIYWSPETGAHVVMDGAIRDAWGAKGFEAGEYGWPTSDLEDIPAGGLKQSFQGGVIKQINGNIVEER